MAAKTLKEIMGMNPEDLYPQDGMDDHCCPECGAPPGEECDCLGCESCESCGMSSEECTCEDPRDYNDARRDAKHIGEGVDEFDKFMDKILISEGYGKKPVLAEDNPQRRRAAKHQDRPGNKIRFGGK